MPRCSYGVHSPLWAPAPRGACHGHAAVAASRGRREGAALAIWHQNGTNGQEFLGERAGERESEAPLSRQSRRNGVAVPDRPSEQVGQGRRRLERKHCKRWMALYSSAAAVGLRKCPFSKPPGGRGCRFQVSYEVESGDLSLSICLHLFESVLQEWRDLRRCPCRRQRRRRLPLHLVFLQITPRRRNAATHLWRPLSVRPSPSPMLVLKDAEI